MHTQYAHVKKLTIVLHPNRLALAAGGAQLLGDPGKRGDAPLDFGAAGRVAFLQRLDELARGAVAADVPKYALEGVLMINYDVTGSG